MAFDFLGTANKSQIARFFEFARAQVPLVEARIQHLEAEKERMGVLVFRFATDGTPQSYEAQPVDSYLGRLLAAYEVLGGNPFHDLRVRLRNDPIYLLPGTEERPAQFMSNGEVLGAKGLADGPSAELMRKARGWVNETIRYRFERLERKIRRVVDYTDELDLEITTLQKIQAAVTESGSLEFFAQQVNELIADPNYRAIFDDQGKDPFGFTSYAPFSSYDTTVDNDDPNAVDRTANTAQRQNSGYVGPGEKG